MKIQEVKQRFGVIGNSPLLDRAIEIAIQVAPTDMTVLITGESGTGKEVFPQIIHHLSKRKHGTLIAVNCGAIPEGTIDSELFGHEKGSFTGAHDARKGYFEVANGGTIFLDEVAELPLSTQVRLLRVLESGEFLRVGSSKVIKTDVRVVAATNVNLTQAVATGKFREDLYYRLNTVPIRVPSLRDRKEDIYLLFRKFTADFADKYKMPPIRLSDDAVVLLENYRWPGNVRQLRNIAEQMSIIEQSREIDANRLNGYLPADQGSQLPVLVDGGEESQQSFSERELLYKVLFDMKRDMTDLKKLVADLMHGGTQGQEMTAEKSQIIRRLYADEAHVPSASLHPAPVQTEDEVTHIDEHEDVTEESLSLVDKEVELIKKALEKHKGRRKKAAEELGISERTLYRKIKEYGM
ncbi:MAG: sigma-54-dependent Fis family transcriptional regulator [Flavobacteriales bacterium]|nr:sigma-54-dependent Fis family transcriptional regulator [Flavobacteriales bacterium]MCB9449438.1 sigma-54-dependent Fis family transcriptional regulator [Flavobacteriales bacterium]